MEEIEKNINKDWFKLGRSKEKQIKQTNTILFGIFTKFY